MPLLDRQLVEMLLGIPTSVRSVDEPKAILKRVLRGLPGELVDRPKQGFALPVHQGLRTELRDSLRRAISTDSLAKHSLLSAGEV